MALGKKMALELPENSIVALSGELGSGKTTFTQGLALGLQIQELIQSPTFVLLNIYDDRLFHFDLYRIKDGSDFLAMGFEEYFTRGGICVIEWPEKIESLLPRHTTFIHFSYSQNQRTAVIRT